MCGRYVLEPPVDKLLGFFQAQAIATDAATDRATAKDTATADRSQVALWMPSYNIAPTTLAPVVRLNRAGERVLILHHWGLVPHWAKDTTLAAKLTNARSETMFDKPSFRTAASRFRCLIPASGYYEWQANPCAGQPKQPWYLRAQEAPYLAMAGICDHWQQPDGSIRLSFSVVTCAAHPDLAHIHDRMPVMIQPKDWTEWLSTQHPDPRRLERLLVPTAGLAFHRVSRAVSGTRSNRQDHPGLIEPLQ